MFIFWGRKLVKRKLGYVADFCPICRTQKQFELLRVGSASHVYYISMGEGTLVGHERSCQECGTAFATDPTTYASISKILVPLPELEKRTFPNYCDVMKERLELEKMVQTNPALLSPEDRHALIRSPFLLLSPKVENRYASTHIDKEIGLSIAGAICLMVFGSSLVRTLAPDMAELSVLIFIVLGVVLVVWQIVISGRRFLKRQIVPSLAKTLDPLRPTEHEIKTVLAELSQLGHKIGKKFVLADLISHMQAAKMSS